jgi:hypothetical protein
VKKATTLKISEAKIAQPSESIDKPALVNPSIFKTPKFKKPLTQATAKSKAPFMTNEIRPKVKMYAGKAMTLITGAITELMKPKTRATAK